MILLGLASLIGCQGLGSKPQSDGPGQLTPTPASFNLGNVTVGTSQTMAGSVSNTGQSSITVTQVTVTGTGYSIKGMASQLTLAVGQSADFSIVFAPTSTGAASGNLALSTATGTVNIPLSGDGVSPGALTTSPTSINFGNVTMGNTSSQPETIRNTGGSNLTVTAATVSGAGFNYTGLSLPLTLAPNQASTFGISFAPSTVGTNNGSLALTVTGSASTIEVALSGAGVTPATLSANPTSLTFTNVPVGQSSTQTEIVQNTGGSSAQISGVTASGAGFSVTGILLPVTLPAGQSVSFNVTYTPQSAGNSSGSVSVSSDAQNSTLSIPLTGSGAAVQGTLSVSNPIAVGNVVEGLSGTQTGTLTASGTSVQVNSVTIGGTNPNEFSVTGLTFPVTVNTNQPVSFTVTFTPGATGAASATASFASNASNSPAVATLTGNGTAPPVHTVQLTWNPSGSQGITSYNVYRAVFGSGSCGSYSNVGSTSGSVTKYTDSSVTDGTTYCYATTAVDSSGESGYSNTAQATIPNP